MNSPAAHSSQIRSYYPEPFLGQNIHRALTIQGSDSGPIDAVGEEGQHIGATE
jgi:hypothetical protein